MPISRVITEEDAPDTPSYQLGESQRQILEEKLGELNCELFVEKSSYRFWKRIEGLTNVLIIFLTAISTGLSGSELITVRGVSVKFVLTGLLSVSTIISGLRGGLRVSHRTISASARYKVLLHHVNRLNRILALNSSRVPFRELIEEFFSSDMAALLLKHEVTNDNSRLRVRFAKRPAQVAQVAQQPRVVAQSIPPLDNLV